MGSRVCAGRILPGSLPVVQDNFSLIIYAIIGVSLLAVGSVILGMVRKAQPNPAEEQTVAGKEGIIIFLMGNVPI